jgi:diguanylate cyclase
MYSLHAITGQFRDDSAEKDFRAFVLPQAQRDSRLALLVTALAVGLFGISDYQFLGLSPVFYQLIGIRVVLITSCVALAFVLYSSDALLKRPWLYSVVPLLAATAVILIVGLRPQTLPTQTTAVVVTIMAIYLFVPNVMWGMIGASLYMSAGFLLGAWYWAGVAPINLLPLGILLLIANLVSYLVALRLARLQRQQFALLQEERLSKERLEEEVARRETLERQLRNMAQTDELTGLSNRRHFMEIAEAELADMRRDGQPFCICMIDVDNFKAINDRWGHSTGDRVLHEVARICLRTFRSGGPVSRFGGEEFVAALPGMRLPDAHRIAERLRKRIEGMQLEGAPEALRVTVTVGLSIVLPHEADLEPAIRRADAALYQGKRSGRNMVLTEALDRSA